MAIVAWIHAIAATAWIGGSIVFAVVIRPVSRADPEGMQRVLGPISSVYRELVDIAVIAILISGVILSFDRLTSPDADAVYASVLALKLALALVMFYVVWMLRRASPGTPPRGRILGRISWLLGYNAIVALGLVVYFLADVLAAVFQANLRAG
ncbi:MAG: hypothetical protein HYY34_00735 [Chloroflexi bacterium]|nr:hypothetical protein [Chloroflexota bacterium]